jgi:hypothetical protein
MREHVNSFIDQLDSHIKDNNVVLVKEVYDRFIYYATVSGFKTIIESCETELSGSELTRAIDIVAQVKESLEGEV